MQLAAVGRNEPCPCGSGRKYKKCCWAAQDAAAPNTPSELDVAALVDRAIAADDWEPVYEVFDQGFELFEPMAPLEHVRFRDHLITGSRLAPGDLSRLCEGGWLRHCEQEIRYVLDRYELNEGKRDGLRLMVYMLRRFGAQSPVVESLVELQAVERRGRTGKLADILARLGLTVGDVPTDGAELFAWIERERPPILAFADWFALRMSDVDTAEALWLSRISPRVCDTCLSLLERPELPDVNGWLQLAVITIFGEVPRLGAGLARWTPARTTTDDERRLYSALTSDVPPPPLPGILSRIIEATDARNDFAGAAVLREAQQHVTTSVRR